MNKLKITFFVLVIVFTGVKLHSQSNPEAAQYMFEVTQKAFELDDETWDYLKAVTRGKKASTVEDKRRALTKAIKTAELGTARKKDFNGSTQFRDAIVNYLNLRHTVLKEDYDKILNMEAIAEQSYDGMEAYLLAQEQARNKLDSAFEIMSNAQKSFAEQYGITLNDNRDKMAKQIRSAAETLEYYNDVYLIFFKSYKQELYVLDAIERNDVSSIEQNNNTLFAFSEEGINKLKTIKSFKGDGSLTAEAKKVLDFYMAESKNEFNSVSDYFLAKEKFEKLNKKMENLSNKEKTKELIDKYNSSVNEYNQAGQTYNGNMQNAYKKRVDVLNSWNKKVDSFISSHSK